VAASLIAVVLVAAFGAGSALAQPTLVSPATGAAFARNASSIVFTVTVPPGAVDTTVQLSSSAATNADGSLATPSALFFGIASGSPATYTWQPQALFAAATYYWQATSFVCDVTTPPFSCPGNEVSPVQSIVLTALPPPAPVSPANGVTQTASPSTKFVFTPNAQSEDTKLVIVFARSNAVGADGVLTQPSYTTADLTLDEGISTNSNVSVPITAALDVPGTIYWQPVRVNCSDNPTAPCNVAGPVSSLTLKKAPPPPLHVQLGGATTFRIGTPNIAWTVWCSEACAGSESVRGSVQVGHKTVSDGQFDVGPTRFSINARHRQSFHFVYTGTVLAELKRAVSLHGAVGLEVIVTATAKVGGRTARATRSLTMHPNPAPPPPRAPTPAPVPAPAPAKPSTLNVHDFSGNVLAVSVSIFGDPATPANQFDKPSSGDKLVAIQEHLTDLGPGTVSDDANNATSLVGSNNQVYTPSFSDVQGCTNFALGVFTLFRGQSESGCVVFELPESVGISRVAFTLGVDTVQFINNG